MSCIEGSNPSASAKPIEAPEERSSGAFLMEGAKPPGQGVFQLSAFTKVIVYIGIGFFALVALAGMASRTHALVVPALTFATGIALLAWGGGRLQRWMSRPRAGDVRPLNRFVTAVVGVGVGFFLLVAILGLASPAHVVTMLGLGAAGSIALLAWSGMKVQRWMNRPRADGSPRSALGKFGIAVAFLLVAASVFVGVLGIASGQWILFRLALVLGGVVLLIAWSSTRAMAALDAAPSSDRGEVGRLQALSERHAQLNQGLAVRAKRTIAILAIVAAAVNLVGVVIRLLPTLLR